MFAPAGRSLRARGAGFIYNRDMSTMRAMRGGWVDRRDVPRGPNGRGLCRWCSLEVPRGRYTFCSAYCVHEWKLRTQPAYLREQVFLRDRGICAACGADAIAAARQLRHARSERRRLLLEHWKPGKRRRRALWEADHIVPVAEGGGECDLENIRTLCLPCHRAATLELRKRMRTERRRDEQTNNSLWQKPQLQ